MNRRNDSRAGRASSMQMSEPRPTESVRAIVLCTVTNFTTLRRRLGETAWDGRVASLMDRLNVIEGVSDVRRIAPDCVQFAIAGAPSSIASKLHLAQARAGQLPDGDDSHVMLFLAFGAAWAAEPIERLVLLERAEAAVADAVRGPGVNIVEVNGDAETFEDLELLRDLPGSTLRGEMLLHYQPKINIRAQCVSSAEALIRWLHPRHGLVMPDRFIDIADESGDIVEIALWTLEQVLVDQQKLRADGHDLRIFINISGRLLTDRNFIDTACAVVAERKARIGFEITETSVIRDPDLAIANLEQCAAVGISLAIDDYGSGLSSLSYLKRLPASELKIDKQFVTELTSSHRDPLIVRSTIDLAHALDMEVTAEGVETPAALALLTVMGCEMVQGYLISPPLLLNSLVRYLREYDHELFRSEMPTVNRPASFWKSA